MFKSKLKFDPPSLTRKLLLIAALLSTINILVQIAIFQLGLRKEWFLLFNMDKEMNIPTFYTVGLLFSCALLIRLIKNKLQKSSNIIKKWKLLEWIFIFLAFDEALQIHEILIIPDLKPFLPSALAIIWVIPYGIITFFLSIYFVPLMLELPKRIKYLFIWSGSIYLLGAIGLEIVGNYLVRTGQIRLHGLPYGLITGLEETMEIIGLIIFIYSLLKYLFIIQSKPIKINIRIEKSRTR